MHTAMIGLARMGRNMASRLLRGGHAIAANNRIPAKAEGLKRNEGAAVAYSLQEAVDTGVSAPVIALSLMQRFRSRQEDTFADRVLAALRREFGGHAIAPSAKGNS